MRSGAPPSAAPRRRAPRRRRRSRARRAFASEASARSFGLALVIICARYQPAKRRGKASRVAGLAIEAKGLVKAFDGKTAVRRHRSRRARRQHLRHSRPQRRRQDDDLAHAARHHRSRSRHPHLARPRTAARSGADRRLSARGARPLSRDEDQGGDRLHGRAARPAARRRAAGAAEALLRDNGLADYADKPIKTLSKGMAQTVQLLGTIVHRPRLIVLDEPFSGLDAINQGRLESLIRDEAAARRHDHLLDPCHRPCRAAVRADRDHRRRQDPLRGRGRRGARPAAPAGPAEGAQCRRAVARRACRPAPARTNGVWLFELPAGGIEPLLRALIDGGAGHRGAVDRAARPARRLRRHRRRGSGARDGQFRPAEQKRHDEPVARPPG